MKIIKTGKLFFPILAFIFLFANSNLISQWTNSINFPTLRVNGVVKCGDKLFAGTTTGILNIGQIYSSTDDGVTWELVNTGFNLSGVFAMAVRNNYIFVGTYESGILISSN